MRDVFVSTRMASLPGLLVMILVGTGLAFAGAKWGSWMPVYITAISAAIIFAIFCLLHPEFAYYVFFYSIIIFTLPARLFGIGLPLGFLIEATGYLCIFAIMAEQYKKRTPNLRFWRTPISLMLLLFFFYYILEAFNPEIDSLYGWLSFFRKQILYLLFYVASFFMFDSIEKIRRFIKNWIILACLIALWGIKQHFLGFTRYEELYIHSDPNITNLLFQGGLFRKFSLLPDPASFGVLCASCGLFTLVLALRTPVTKIRTRLFLVTILQLVASTYSGTRTCNVMVVGGLLAYVVFTFNEKKSIQLMVGAVVISALLIFGPFRNSPVIYRIKTTFEGGQDPSNMVRDINRKTIQPYVYAHPLGGGLQTSGEDGRRFYPTHPLAGFPPDSGYTKIMLEEGWIGLALTLIFYFFILQRGITGFYESRRSEIRNLYIAFTICFFSLAVGQYSQLAISQYPLYLFYLSTLVIFYKLKEYDNKNPSRFAPAA